MARSIRTGAAARTIGIHPQTLRKWEREGRVPPARRNQITGQRLYDDEDLDLVRRLAADNQSVKSGFRGQRA